MSSDTKPTGDGPQLELVAPVEDAPTRRGRGIRPGQIIGMESPAIKPLVPVVMSKHLNWWSPDDVLVWGVSVPKLREMGPDSHNWREHPKVSSTIGFYPQTIPRSWYGQEIGAAISYMAESGAQFQLRFLYACGEETELCKVTSDQMQTSTVNGSQAGIVHFDLDESRIQHDGVFASTLQIIRASNHQIVIRTAWLALGIDRTANQPVR
jgi:hypothetical protein